MDYQPEYTGQHLFSEIDQLNDQLDEMVGELRKCGRALAEAEAEYRKGLTLKILELRAVGMPVTIINDLSRGDDGVALLKLERDAAEANYKAAQEAINVGKLRVRTVSEQIAREWGRPSNA